MVYIVYRFKRTDKTYYICNKRVKSYENDTYEIDFKHQYQKKIGKKEKHNNKNANILGLLKEGQKSCRAKWYVGTCSGHLMYSADLS